MSDQTETEYNAQQRHADKMSGLDQKTYHPPKQDKPMCPDCQENRVPIGSSTGLCYNCEEHSNKPNDYDGDF